MPAKKQSSRAKNAAKKATPDATIKLVIPGPTLEGYTGAIGYKEMVLDPQSPTSPGDPPNLIENPQSREDYAREHLVNNISALAGQWVAQEAQRVAMEKAQGVTIPPVTAS